MRTEDVPIKIPTMLIMTAKKFIITIILVALIVTSLSLFTYHEKWVEPANWEMQKQINHGNLETFRNTVDLFDAHLLILQLEERVSELVKPTSFSVRMTNYYPVEEQCDADPLTTASMKVIIPDDATNHRWIAISWDLHKWLSTQIPKDDPAYGKGQFEMGDYVELTGYGNSVDGIYQITDTMNSRHRMAIDRLTNVNSPLEFAENVTITKVFIPELHPIDA